MIALLVIFRYTFYKIKNTLTNEGTIMKRFLILATAFAFVAAAYVNAAETNEVFRIDFEQSEGYQLGDVFSQDKGWTHSVANSNCLQKVVNKDTFGTIRSGDQALFVCVQDTSYGRAASSIDFDLSSIDIDKNYVQFEAQVKPSEVGEGNYSMRFQLTDTNNVNLCDLMVYYGGFWCMAYSLKTSSVVYPFNPDSNQGGPEKIQGKADFSQFTTICYTWDLGKKQLISLQLGDEMCYYTNRWDESGNEYTPNPNIPYGFRPEFSGLPSRLRVNGQNERPEWGFDAFVIRTISKPKTANPAKLNCAATTVVNNQKSTSCGFGITNDGDIPFDFTVSTDSEWLVPNASTGTCVSSATISFTLDREKMTESKYYRAMVTVDAGDAGMCQVRVCAQSDMIYFAEDFEAPYIIWGGIMATQDRWENNMQPPSDYNIVATNAYDRENIGFITRTSSYDGQIIAIDSGENEIIHVGMDMYVPSDTETTQFHFKSGYWSLGWDLLFSIDPLLGTLGVKSINNNDLIFADWQGSLDEWMRVEILVDYQAQIIKSVQLGDFITNGLAIEVMKDTNKQTISSFVDLSLYATPPDTDKICGIGLDNIIVEQQERTGEPELFAPAFVSFGEEPKGKYTLRNAGTGSIGYTVEALDNDACFTFEPSKGDFTDKAEVNVTINREGLEPGYYRSRIVANGGEAGVVTSVFTFACGGIFYTCDFDEPWFHEGTIRGQEGWTYDPDQPAENFSEVVKDEALFIGHAPGYTGLRSDIIAPNKDRVAVSTWFYCSSEEGEDGSILYFKQNDAWPYLEFMLTRNAEEGVVKLTVTGMEETNFFMTASMDEWQPFSYTINFYENSIKEITFGDETRDTSALFSIKEPEKPFTRYLVCSSDDANFYIDRIMIYDPEQVPEPAVVALLALALAAFLRRK